MAKWVRVEYTETTRRDCYVKAESIDEVKDLIKDGKVYEEENLEVDITLDSVVTMSEKEIEEAGL
ncbi:hypothetical protein DIRTYBETTY_210 [Bacillus phage DirtyBetty]|uniref:Uncharacterized protein n=2 Tax=Wphvirus megatron TaxID=1987728 RepID=A0A1B1PAW7_9CAUD|nr:hypothetical protein QLX47_gp208 [Bacillus phage Eyuki]YP_009285152.1 hypothetical protein BIZ88_gp210 [Bacillus phage DirtyBetty]ALA46516.1 hypothetical protein EYUKI_208 [Bacillus phage Eyuki]ANT41295.1 hypothetical protein DIRTYBETTY_210 [Bacillus phage DirtyBetty]